MAKKAAKKKEISWEVALDRLIASPKTRYELKCRLLEKGCPADTAENLLDQYQEFGIIDDKAYAVLFIDSKNTCGIRRLRDELRYKGVSAENIEEAIEEMDIDEDERAIDYALSVCGIGNMTKGKLIDRLERRGFAYSSIRAALRQLRDEGIRLYNPDKDSEDNL